MGRISETHDWDWAAADASFQRALELAPGDANALRAAAGLARILGHSEKAVDLIGKAIALDPLSAFTHRQAAMIHLVAGQLEETATSFQLALDINPKGGLYHAFLAITRLLQGRLGEARALAGHEGHDVFRNLALTLIEHKLGNAAASDAALKTLIDGFGWTAAFQIAEAYAFRGEVDKAYEWLESAYRQRDPGVVFTAVDTILRPLHSDPRWTPFVRRLGLG